jgi:hypothetical protein
LEVGANPSELGWEGLKDDRIFVTIQSPSGTFIDYFCEYKNYGNV